MSTRVENYIELVPIICSLPVGSYYDVKENNRIELQAKDQKAVKAIRESLPMAFWKKKYRGDCGWWEYDGILNKGDDNEVTVHIYACHESPPSCKAIIETKMVEERVATEYTTRMVEKEVIVGYDCSGDNGDSNDPEPEEDVVVESPTEHH